LPSLDGSIFKDKEKEPESELIPVPLVEERLNVSKNEVICREAKLIKEPIIETQTVEVPVTYEELIVERRPASKRTYYAHNLIHPVLSRVEIRIPLRKEEIEVKKELMSKKLSLRIDTYLRNNNNY
jgi:uncharacterized protein (TIGR02271 family)